MGKINILNDAGTNKLSLEFNGTSDSSLNTENLVLTANSFSTDGLVIPSLSADPADGTGGQLYYHSIDKTIRFYNGTEWANIYTPPFDATSISGCVGWYDADSWTGSQWTDKSGSDNHATSYSGTIVQETHNGISAGVGASKKFTVLRSTDNTSGITFPSSILPSTFTLFHVTRYNTSLGDTSGNGTRGRIFDGVTPNWLSGFHGGGSGKFYHEGWITDESNKHGNYWVQSTDMNDDGAGGSLVRSRSTNANNGNWYQDTGGGNASRQLTLNNGNFTDERSLWMVAEVIVYNRALTQAEYNAVEDYLTEKYGI